MSGDAAEGLVVGAEALLALALFDTLLESSVALLFCGVGPPKSSGVPELPGVSCCNLDIGIPGAEDLLVARISAAASISLFVAIEYLLMISYL